MDADADADDGVDDGYEMMTTGSWSTSYPGTLAMDDEARVVADDDGGYDYDGDDDGADGREKYYYDEGNYEKVRIDGWTYCTDD